MDASMRAGLVEVAGSLPMFASPGLEHRAETITAIVASAYDYLAGLLEVRPPAEVVVLSEADWPAKGRAELFGLPNAGDGVLVVAGTEAGWWSSLAELAGDAGQAAVARVYGSDGAISLAGFFDLVAVHEVAHLFAQPYVAFPRRWLGELFANLALHAWVERIAPENLPALVTLPRLTAAAPATMEYQTRAEFEEHYSSVGGQNYVWYEFRLQVEAAELYAAGGEQTVRRLFEAFRAEHGYLDDDDAEFDALRRSIDDDALAARLSDTVDPQLGAFSLVF